MTFSSSVQSLRVRLAQYFCNGRQNKQEILRQALNGTWNWVTRSWKGSKPCFFFRKYRNIETLDKMCHKQSAKWSSARQTLLVLWRLKKKICKSYKQNDDLLPLLIESHRSESAFCQANGKWEEYENVCTCKFISRKQNNVFNYFS